MSNQRDIAAALLRAALYGCREAREDPVGCLFAKGQFTGLSEEPGNARLEFGPWQIADIGPFMLVQVAVQLQR
ncbi:hypothetical protein N8D56_03485 [Devosia sp. A8/3-2]|nr:hypothetical protein N8D56_03485 [Devosia sp. A8/3-2]